MRICILAALAFFCLASGVAKAGEPTPAAAPAAPKHTIRLNIDPALQKLETEYIVAEKNLTPEQQAALKTFQIEDTKAIDGVLRAIDTLFQVRHCAANDEAFKKEEQQHRAEAGVYAQQAEMRANAARQEIRARRLTATPFIDARLVDGHYAFFTQFAMGMYEQMSEIGLQQGKFAKTDCAALARHLAENYSAAAAAAAPNAPGTAGHVAQLKARADSGDNDAMTSYGLVLLSGQGVAPDAAAGVAYLQRAADAGYSRGQYMLGLMHGMGMAGGPADKEKAKFWLGKAAAQGDKKAEAMLKSVDQMKPPPPIEELRKRAEAGDAGAAYDLSGRYAYGMYGTPKDQVAADKWRLFSAGKGHPLAQSDLAVQMLANGKVEEGISWMTKAAEGGVVNSQYELASIYAAGKLVPADPAKAKAWAGKAAAQGDARAVKLLAGLSGN
ncbi:MAG TPA: tetratricopeptide repeat protein [Patescibacteria group bacterium]|nr:tetratricopeptide repeat protein [Patescibacteria group bacterium]